MGSILLLTFLGCLALGVPIAFSVAVAGVVVLIIGDVNLLIVVQRLFASSDSFSLVAIPFFILAGDLLARGEMSKMLVAFAEACIGKIKGGLSAVSVLASMFFAAISGSGAATTAAVGTSMLPELEKKGVRGRSCGCLNSFRRVYRSCYSSVCSHGSICCNSRTKCN